VIYGEKYTPSIPVYGNKVIAIREGIIEAHGSPVSKVWTELLETAEAGQQSIVVKGQLNGWKEGDSIAIAASGMQYLESEDVIIKSITVDE